MLLRDIAGEAALLSLEGPLLIGLLMGLEGGRLLAGDAPLEGKLDLSGLLGALLRSGLHPSSALTTQTHIDVVQMPIGLIVFHTCAAMHLVKRVP